MEHLMNIDLPLPGKRLGSFLVKQKQLVPELNLEAFNRGRLSVSSKYPSAKEV